VTDPDLRTARQKARDFEIAEMDHDARIRDLEEKIEILEAEKQDLLNSTSWRLSAPVRTIGRLVERIVGGLLGRAHVLTPARLFDVQATEPGTYQATDIRPFFLLSSSRGRFPCGWVEITYRLKAEDRVVTPSLFADPGEGSTEADRKRLPPTEGKTVTCYLRLPDKVRAMRFDPINWKGRFEMDPILVREISRLQLGIQLIANQVREDGLPSLFKRFRRGGWAGMKEYLARQATKAIDNYENWRGLFWSLSEADKTAITQHVEQFAAHPTFSVVMPTYNSDPEHLRAAIDSVRTQLYPHWELCIADDASTKPEVRRVLEDAVGADPRIKVTYRESNGHIAEASNSALELATGDYIALLDHDDALTADALYWMAIEVIAHPDAAILYSDEDKIDETGRLFHPYFKPDWSPELVLSQNYVNHLGVYRREEVEAVGRFRDAFRGSQDYDLMLRISDRVGPDRIRHVPVVLYHWRTVAGSVASGGDAKSYAHDAARRAIAEHLERTRETAQVVPTADGFGHRVVPAMPDPTPKVTIVVPTRDKVEVLKVCIDGLLTKTDYTNWELFVVDNGSERADTARYLGEISTDPRIRVLRDDGAFNYSRLNNIAVAQGSGEMVLLLNNDVEPINPDWLGEMVRQLSRSGVGVVGAKLYFPDDTVQHVGVTTGIGGVAGHFEKRLPREADGYFQRPNLLHNATAVTGACLLTTRALWDEVGGLDEEHLTVAFNDVDFCLKIREAGRRIVVAPLAELYHYESVSRGTDNAPEKLARFRREMATMRARWDHVIDQDPYWNPNLHIDNEMPTLGFPPRVQKPWRHLLPNQTT
jgi:GT2 family glycosyltransferase